MSSNTTLALRKFIHACVWASEEKRETFPSFSCLKTNFHLETNQPEMGDYFLSFPRVIETNSFSQLPCFHRSLFLVLTIILLFGMNNVFRSRSHFEYFLIRLTNANNRPVDSTKRNILIKVELLIQSLIFYYCFILIFLRDFYLEGNKNLLVYVKLFWALL